MATFTTQQVVDMLVQVLSKSAGLEGFNVTDVAGVDSNTLTMKVAVPAGTSADPRYTNRTVTIDVAIA